MPVFRLLGKLINHNKGTLIMYFGIFFAISILLSQFGNDSGSNFSFEETSLDVAVIDKDNTKLSKALTEFLDKNNNLISIEYDKQSMQDALYYREVQYILIINAGYENEFDTGNTKLETIKVPGSTTGYLLDNQIEQFMQNVSLSYAITNSMEESVKSAIAASNTVTDIELLNGKTENSSSRPSIYYYMRYVPYVTINILVLGLGILFTVLYKPDIRKRNACSALSSMNYNIQLTLGCVLFSLVIGSLILLAVYVVYHNQAQLINFPLAILNVGCDVLVCMGLGLFSGMVAKTNNALTGLANVFSLSMCFLGGIFVDKSIMGDGVQKFMKLLPTYWYSTANELICNGSTLTASQQSEVFMAMGIQIGFAAAFIVIALVIGKRKHEAVMA